MPNPTKDEELSPAREVSVRMAALVSFAIAVLVLALSVAWLLWASGH